jgi:hypothetical protein
MVDQLAASYQILLMETPCFRESGFVMDAKPDQLLEGAMIAATAHVHRLIVQSENGTRTPAMSFSGRSRMVRFIQY